ncbi:hypothetical protein [Allohahella sp. A8]|uniref:hypothetical protein n=1 Tax=Allohahella sp. A8 TaxID=3141461 RepID=UPI003A81398B
MAIKETELHSSLWASCDELPDASQYKEDACKNLMCHFVTESGKSKGLFLKGLEERYAEALPAISKQAEALSEKVAGHLKAMGLVWNAFDMEPAE